MRNLVAITIVAALSAAPASARGGHAGAYAGTGSNGASHTAQGYTTHRGTYVAPHRETNPNSTMRDNYGVRGNVNPSTGAVGTRLVPY